MEAFKIVGVLKNYKECPYCGVGAREANLQVTIDSDLIHIKCSCGFECSVDENNTRVGIK